LPGAPARPGSILTGTCSVMVRAGDGAADPGGEGYPHRCVTMSG